MAATFAEYLRFLDKLEGIVKQLADIEKEKIGAVKKDDLLLLDDCMKREQVLSLSLRSMDRQRDKMLSELGLEGVRLSGLASHYPDDLKQQAKETAERVQRQFGIYRSAAQTAYSMLEINLHEIEKHMGGEDMAKIRPAGPMADIRA